MTADTFDPILGLLLMGTGNDNNSWGTNANVSVFSPAARAIAGVNTITSTGGTVDLSGSPPPAGLRADIDHVQLLNALLTADVTVKVPNIAKTWWFENDTTGAFNVFVQVPSGVSPNGLVQIPQGLGVMVMCDGGGNLRRHDRAQVGTAVHHFGVTAPAGALACNGASLLRAEFPDLFNAISTTWGSADSLHFTLPLLTDTNRYLRAGGGAGPAVGTYQSSQNKAHTHTAAGTTGTESATHTHTQQGTFTSGGMSANDPHTHSIPAISGNAQQAAPDSGNELLINSSGTTGSTSIAHTHNVTISGQTGTESATHTHTFSVTTSGGSADGTEARPESAAVLICIRY